ncbi:hypothetical protein [Aliarcobacter butzleri]|uniref:hypothetical protein n=1 Tax=Aliarcobacter butzleri TaxID=28197 RepID=UPI003AF5ACEA
MLKKKEYINLITYFIMGLGIYLGYYYENENINNIGVFITWIYSILFIFAIFSKEDEKQNNKYFKILLRILLSICILALAYKGEYIHATIWFIFFMSILKIKL